MSAFSFAFAAQSHAVAAAVIVAVATHVGQGLRWLTTLVHWIQHRRREMVTNMWVLGTIHCCLKLCRSFTNMPSVKCPHSSNL